MTPQAKANELYPDHIIRSKNPNEIPTKVPDQRREAYIKGREDERAELVGTPDEAEEVLKPYLWEGFDGSSVMNVEQVIEAMQTFAASRVAKEMSAEMQSLKQLEREKEIEDALARGIEQGIEQYQRELREELQKIGKLHFSIPDKEKEQYKEQIQSLQQQIEGWQEAFEKEKIRGDNWFQKLSEKEIGLSELDFAHTALTIENNHLTVENQRLTAEVERLKKENSEYNDRDWERNPIKRLP